MRLPALVSQVESDAVTARSVVVALGDSITEGATSTPNTFRSWVDRLTERLAETPAGQRWSVVNAGIGGNRLMRYGTGPAVLARFDRDVLDVPGVKAMILMEGINDLGGAYLPGQFFPPEADETVTAESLEAIDRQLIARAHAYGIKVIGATLTPYEGANYFDQRGEVIRKALNQWILTGGAFDGVIDFDAVVRDPAHPDAIRADYNIFDHLHPNDAGYRAMGDAINLKLIAGR
jgi:lysophospholipase L1-like esterase